MTYHIIPMGELDLHEDNTKCHCHPYLEVYEGDLFVAHYSVLDKDRAKQEIMDKRDGEFTIITN